VKFFIFINLLVLLLTNAWAGSYFERQDVKAFIQTMVEEYDYSGAELEALFKSVKEQKQVAKAIKAPAERKKQWHEYRPIFITQSRIKNGVKFWHQHAAILAEAEQQFGVPAEIIVAIIGVETYFGKHTGKHPVFDSLVTLGFGPTRSKFFRSELRHYLLLCREESLDPSALYGSYAGAMGLGQFISSSYRHYSVDGDGDGRRDLWNSPRDIIFSVANYFKQHGWKHGQAVTQRMEFSGDATQLDTKNKLKPSYTTKTLQQLGFDINTDSKDLVSLIVLDQKNTQEYWLGEHNFYVITRYNHSHMYAMAVYQLSKEIMGQWCLSLANQ